MKSIIDEKFRNINVFVYCGGKCGSKTLCKTLNQYFKALHNHTAERFYIDYPGVNNKYSIFDVIDYNSQTNKQIYIIDAYRDPIERKVSSFFNNIHRCCPNYKSYLTRRLITFFNNKYLYNIEEYHPLDEVMEHYGLKPFDCFDFDKKYNIVSKGNIHFIKLRFKDIKIWDKLLSEIFKRTITILPDNISENKEYKDIYKKFKDYYYIPSNYFNNILPNDKHFKIYNTEEEQQEYYKKWKQRLLPGM
jgi:hypothetical protein